MSSELYSQCGKVEKMSSIYTLSIARGDVAVFNGITRFEIEESLPRCKGITFIYDPGAQRHLMNEAGIAPPSASE